LSSDKEGQKTSHRWGSTIAPLSQS